MSFLEFDQNKHSYQHKHLVFVFYFSEIFAESYGIAFYARIYNWVHAFEKKSCWIQWDTDSDLCQEIKVSKCQSNLPLHAYVPKQILWLDYIIVAETHSNLASLYVTVFYDKNIHAPKPYRLKEKKMSEATA